MLYPTSTHSPHTLPCRPVYLVVAIIGLMLLTTVLLHVSTTISTPSTTIAAVRGLLFTTPRHMITTPPRLVGSISPPGRIVTGRLAVVTLISLTPEYCHLAYSFYRNLRRVDPLQRYEYVVMYHEAQNTTLLRSNPHCAELRRRSLREDLTQIPRVRFLVVNSDIQKMIDQPWIHILHPQWVYSMNRLEIFRHDEYDRVAYIDIDTLILRSIDNLFDQTTGELAMAVDQWNRCEPQQKLNGGVMVATPSQHLFGYVKDMLLGDTMKTCLSGELRESDQELLNCMCGYGGADKALRPEVTCEVMDYFTNLMPQTVHCPYYNPDDVMIVHFSGRKTVTNGTATYDQTSDLPCVSVVY